MKHDSLSKLLTKPTTLIFRIFSFCRLAERETFSNAGHQ